VIYTFIFPHEVRAIPEDQIAILLVFEEKGIKPSTIEEV
jgi:hypothetical protein